MSISDAQKDMRDAYYGGATGAVTSATAWLAAALVAAFVDPLAAVVTLLVGGMLVPGKHSKGNPLAPLAIEGTI